MHLLFAAHSFVGHANFVAKWKDLPMKKLYVLILNLFCFALVFPLHAQEVFWVAADRYQGAARLITALTNSGQDTEYPIPNTNNDLWGDIRPQIYKGSDGNIYGINSNAEGTLFFKITNHGIFPVYQ